MFDKMVRLRNKKGFTLMELLIVVAIIAILVAISIPIFTSQLEKAREATDVANLRAAKAVAVATYLAGDTDLNIASGAAFTANYDAANGKLITGTPATTYGKGTAKNGGTTDMGYDPAVACAGKYIAVSVDAAGVVTLSWK